jgi:hypothetical protein
MATVDLPRQADGAVVLEDERARLGVTFALRGARNVAGLVANGHVLYREPLDGADVVHRVDETGTEDFIALEMRPAREEVVYDVDVSRVAGLRLVSNTLEFLAASGTPTLRVAPPHVVDASGARRPAMLSVDGCAFDTSLAPPLGRAVTAPGASLCTVRVEWSSTTYPLLVTTGWTTTGSMAAKRIRPVAAALPSGKVLVAGGWWFERSAEIYDPATSTFSATGTMAHEREGATATTLRSGKVLIAGGEVQTGFGPLAIIVEGELFDPDLGTFAPVGHLTGGRASHTATLLPSGKVLVAGGGDSVGVRSGTEIFDPKTKSFSVGPSLHRPRMGHTATLLASGKVLLAGGVPQNSNYDGYPNEPAQSDAELFDPAEGSATSIPTGTPMTTPRVGHTATVLPSGKVLIAGGGPKGDPGGGGHAIGSVATTELFDPSTNGGLGAFVAGPSMLHSRALHVAVKLPSGRVLLVGTGREAVRGQAPFVGVTEVFDPLANAGEGEFLEGPSPVWFDGHHTATPLSFGSILVVGGRNIGVSSSFLGSDAAAIFDESTFTPITPTTPAASDGGTSTAEPGTFVAPAARDFGNRSSEGSGASASEGSEIPNPEIWTTIGARGAGGGCSVGPARSVGRTAYIASPLLLAVVLGLRRSRRRHE